MKKVFFVIPTLSGGGAERVVLHILRHIDRQRFSTVLVVFEKKGPYVADLPPDVNVRVLRSPRIGSWLKWLIIFRFVKLLRAEQPDVVVSFTWYANFVTILAKAFSRVRCRLLISERYSLTHSHEGLLVEFIRKLIIRYLYLSADAVIVNSQDMGNQLAALFPIPKEKILVIYNPVDIPRIIALSKEDVVHSWFHETIPIIIGVGRFTPQKGFNYLIKAIRKLSQQDMKCRLILLGNGPEEDSLKKLSSDLRINDRVLFPGFQQNPYQYLARSTVFILSSLYEGFPNVLLEALALGTPSIATRCPTGPEELVTDGVDGILVPPADEHALATAIERMLSDNALRARLSQAGKKRSMDFAAEHIVKRYEDALESICGGSAEN